MGSDISSNQFSNFFNKVGNGMWTGIKATGKGIGDVGKFIGKQTVIGFHNGNLAKGFQAVGAAATGIGMTAMTIHAMNNSSSSCCCNGGSIWGNYGFGGMGYSPFSGSYMNTGFSGFPSFTGMNTGFTGFPSFTGMQSMQYQPMSFDLSNYFTSNQQGNSSASNDTYTHKLAAAVSSDADKTLGADAATNMDKLGNKEVDRITLTKVTNEATKDTDYVKGIANLAKSYVANFDKGSKDGYISAEEYIESESPSNATERSAAQDAFNQMDINNDGKLDYQEVAAMFAVYDGGGSSNATLDGQITQEEFQAATTKISDGKFSGLAKIMLKKYFDKAE